MKSFILVLLCALVICASAQPGKPPVMAPVFSSGYYVNQRGDTVRGEIQTNRLSEADFYKEFAFRKPRTKRSKILNTKLVKAYGFADRNFDVLVYNNEKLFAERLVYGKLSVYAYGFDGKSNGESVVEFNYFVKDNYAGGEDKGLGELKKISQKFYKKNLRPYMKEQADIWETLDKYNFNRQQLVQAVESYNAHYPALTASK